MRVLLPLAALILGLTGCGSDGLLRSAALDPARTQIDYRFTDASVPPEYHRSFSVDARADGVHIVVDAYGDILFDQTEPIEAEVWAAVVATAAGLGSSAGGSHDCAGATSRDLQISEGDEIVFRAAVSVCGDAGEEQAGVIDAYVAPLLAPFDMEALLAPSN